MKITFKPKQVTRSLLSALEERARDIIERRYGLLNDGVERMTLDAIGQIYGITRERVRQIENASLETIRKSGQYTKTQPIFDELEDVMIEHGGLVSEADFLGAISKDESTQNHANFLLVIGEPFVRIKEDDIFNHRWTTNPEFSEKIHQSLHNLYADMNEQDLVSETDIIVRFLEHLKNMVVDVATEDRAHNWLKISKMVGKNVMGEWGLASSPNVHTRGVRDYAYLVLRKNKEPLHFSDVAKEITKSFDRKAHVATTHNELIKDDRFVLVGRGLYALTEWGYRAGIVREVIKTVLKEKGPMTKEEIISEVKKQRQVKENTIYVNLQNSHYFKKSAGGKYALV